MSAVLEVPAAAGFRSWLASPAAIGSSEVWVVVHHRATGVPSPTHPELVEEALCFGWIDGLQRRRDDTSTLQRFTPRRAGSTWSRLNRERVARLTAEGRMAPAGLASVAQARESGAWLVGEVVPDDLAAALDAVPAARSAFEGFPPSTRRLILEWVASAKRPATRVRRVEATVSSAACGERVRG